MKSAKDVLVGPYLLEAANCFLAFLFISLVPEELFIRFHGAIYCIAPCVPQDHSNMKNFLSELVGYSLTPDGPQELSAEEVPWCIRIQDELGSRIPAQLLLDLWAWRVSH